MFRAIIRPSSGALDCVYSLWYEAPTVLPAGSVHRSCHINTLPQNTFYVPPGQCVVTRPTVFYVHILKERVFPKVIKKLKIINYDISLCLITDT